MNIKIIFRNIANFKLYSGFNILGLGFGLAAVLFIFFWVYNETTYDKYNSNSEQIYQINHLYVQSGNCYPTTPAPLAPAIAENVINVEKVSRLRRCATFAFKAGERMFLEENGATADPELFDIFSFELIRGSIVDALSSPDNILITESFAKRYFETTDAIDQQLTLEGQGEVTVKAIIKDVPSNSHIKFDYLLSHKFTEHYGLCGLGWGDPNFLTYIKIRRNANISDVHTAITQVAKANKAAHIFYGTAIYHIRPLADIYLDYQIPNPIGDRGDSRSVIVFGTVGLLILLLACINYINLSISLFSKRQKSTSIHKICGAFKFNIFSHYLIETLLVILFSIFVAIVLVDLFKPMFINLVGKQIEFYFWNPMVIGFISSLLIGTAILCGVYPALVLSYFNPLSLIDKFNHKRSKNRSLKGMVVVQNVISILLVICTVGIAKQMNFIKNKNLGFDDDKIVYVRLRGQIPVHIEAAKHEISLLPGVEGIAMKDCPPFDFRNSTSGIVWRDKGELKNTEKGSKFGSETTRIDDQFFEMMDVQFVQGRNFNGAISSDKTAYILNEEAVRQMNLEEPIGTEFALYDKWGTIVGVIKDTHFKTLHDKVEPMVFHMFNDLERESYFSILNMKLSGHAIQKSIRQIEAIWTKYNPDVPFAYHFLDQKYEELYASDQRVMGMIKLFSLLAVFIACLGLLGQSILAAENRIKEIGIRKVNGAKVGEILILLNKSFIKWVVIAFVIACPIAWYAMHKWLENFAYKTELSWWIFALAGLLALAIALLTVSWQSWRAARRNPVEALRYE